MLETGTSGLMSGEQPVANRSRSSALPRLYIGIKRAYTCIADALLVLIIPSRVQRWLCVPLSLECFAALDGAKAAALNLDAASLKPMRSVHDGRPSWSRAQ